MLKPGRLLVHMGMPKTGTSSIQAALAATRDQLRTGGPVATLYPVLGTSDNGLAHHRIAREMSGWTPGTPTPFCEALGQTLERDAPDAAILSSEHFSLAHSAVVARHLGRILPEGWGVEVLCYARSPDRDVMSNADQNVTHRWETPPLAALLHERSGDFFLERMLHWWAQAFEGRVTLRAFGEDHLLGGDAVADFFTQVIGPDHPATRAATALPRANVGRPAALVVLMDRTKPLLRAELSDIAPACAQHGNRLMRILREELAPAVAGRTARLRWSRPLIERCHAAAIDGVRALDARWFGTPTLAPDLEAALEAVPPGTVLLSAEEALELSGAEVEKICRDRAKAAAGRFRRVLARLETGG